MEFILARKKRTVVPLMWLLIYLCLVPMQLSNYVLCIGIDGHVDFEIAINGRCTDTHDLHERDIEIVMTADTAEENHCGSCFDFAIFVSLGVEPYLVPIQNPLTDPPPSVTTFIVHPANDSTFLTRPPFPGIPSVISPTIASLRTTTLLI